MSVVFPGTPVSAINKIDRQGIAEILLKKALNTIIISILCVELLKYRLEVVKLFFLTSMTIAVENVIIFQGTL
jgi:hypothetical protein